MTAIRRRLVRQKLGKIVTEPLHKGDRGEVIELYSDLFYFTGVFWNAKGSEALILGSLGTRYYAV